MLATSGTTGAEGESIGNSWKLAKKSEAMVAAVDNFGLSGLSEAASRIQNALSWNDADQQSNEYEDDDDEYNEEAVDWYTGDCDDELDETAYTVGTPTDVPEIS